MEFQLLRDILIIFTLAILVIYVFQKVHIPSIIGFLFTGLLTGPYGLKLIQNTHDVEILAEIGIILLLFTIGIEFSIKNLLKASRSVLMGGALQVGLVILLTFFVSRIVGASVEESVLIGFLVSLSSTAIVMQIIQGRGELGTFHGRTTLAILIFQDIIIVPMILFVPFLAGASDFTGQSLLIALVKGLGVIVAVFLGARFVVPTILYQIARTQNRELFLLTIIVLGFATAFLTYSIGLSLALGAFIAGLIISESEYSEQAFGNIIPFRDLFTSFFFVSVGMLLDIRFILEEPLLVIATALGIMFIKSIVSGFVAFILGYPFKSTLIVGLALSQVGEFSFILSEFGMKYSLLSEFNYQLFLSSAVFTLSLTPFVINLAPKLAEYLLKKPIPDKLRYGLRNFREEKEKQLSDHVIIVGYGIIGRNVAKACKFANIPHCIIELNPDTVKAEHVKGEIIFYGDASQEPILSHAQIKEAQVLVITPPNPADTRRITRLAREINPNLHIIIRTRFLTDMQALHNLGANEVIPEEFETSVEIFSRVLSKFMIPKEKIDDLVTVIRSHEYAMFRKLSLNDSLHSKLSLEVPIPELHMVILTKPSKLVEKSCRECSFRNFNILLLALSREGSIHSDVPESFVFREGDILYFLGTYENFRKMSSELL
jgi:CPA2 family monovalent cation:H+ antiporter-2